MDHIVGIDLGTTNSEISYIRDGRPEVIEIEGEMMMPSCVGIDHDGNLMVGRSAKNQMVVNPEATILSIKRSIGKNVSVQLGEKQFSPEEISSFILGRLKKHAEEYLGEEITQAVITVPAYFDDSQRKSTKNAGILAGLDVKRIINEPTAAALAYDAGKGENKNILVYDLGGGTFDVSMVIVENGVVEVKSSHGDTQLGGDDFDKLLMDHVSEQFKEANGVDLLKDPHSRNRLWSIMEKAKRQLSDKPFVRIREEYISGDKHLDIEISRDEYQEMIRPLVRKTIDCVHKCLKEACFLPKAVDRVILVGGATRTPLVSEMLEEEMQLAPHYEINPDLIVAMGAAIQGEIIAGRETEAVLVDITPYTFGTAAVSNYGGEMREDVFIPIIKRNSSLPISKGEVFYTMVDNQKTVDVRIYQGEEILVENNIFIGNFLVEGLGGVPAGNEIILDLGLDLNGILEVTAREKSTGLSKTVTMTTENPEGLFDLERAHENISEFTDLVQRREEELSPKETEKKMLISEAGKLHKRGEAILDGIDEADAGEIHNLIEQGKDAIIKGDTEKLSDSNESLSDLLFYLED